MEGTYSGTVTSGVVCDPSGNFGGISQSGDYQVEASFLGTGRLQWHTLGTSQHVVWTFTTPAGELSGDGWDVVVLGPGPWQRKIVFTVSSGSGKFDDAAGGKFETDWKTIVLPRVPAPVWLGAGGQPGRGNTVRGVGLWARVLWPGPRECDLRREPGNRLGLRVR